MCTSHRGIKRIEKKISKRGAHIRDSLGRFSERLAKTKSMRRGHIVFRLAEPNGGNYALECAEGRVQVTESAAAGVGVAPLIEA